MAAIANVEMAATWDGEEGDDWTENADRYDATGRWIEKRFHAEVAIEPSDRILDIGCGTGKSTRDAARRASSGSVLGVDLSSRMLDDARRRSAQEGLTNVDFLQGDAQVHPFEESTYDLAISEFGAMFFADPVAAFANVGRGLRPEGRIALLVWQRFEDNEWLTVIFDALAAGRDLPTPQAGSPGPFGLADPDAVTAIVRGAGFADEQLTSVTEPMWVGADAEEAWTFVSEMGLVRGLTDGLDHETTTRAMKSLRHSIDAHETHDGVLFGSAAWLITARKG